MATETELAWAAGFFDGEGCVTVRTYRSTRARKRPCFNLEIAVGQVDPLPLERLVLHLGGKVVRSNKPNPTGERHRRGYHRWVLGGQKAAIALRQLFPYLVAKHEAAAIGLCFVDTLVHAKRGGPPLTVEELAQREALRDQLRAIRTRIFN